MYLLKKINTHQFLFVSVLVLFIYLYFFKIVFLDNMNAWSSPLQWGTEIGTMFPCCHGTRSEKLTDASSGVDKDDDDDINGV